jgi:radical SAM superfamily enzyme YgiQ (UPF0313 family)
MRINFVQAPLRGEHKNSWYLPNLAAPGGLYGIEHGTIGYGMLHLATQVAQEHDVKVWSLSASALTGSLYPSLREIAAGDVVGIQMNWGIESRGALSMASYLKTQNPSLRIIIGGTHASLFASEISKYPYVDFVIRGESEIVVPELLKRLETGGQMYLPGVVMANYDGGFAPIDDNIDMIEPYDPALIASPIMRSIPWAVNRVRGTCPWRCSYCIGGHIVSVSNRKQMRYHSPEWVIRQLELLIRYGAEFVMFQDQAWAATLKGQSEPFSYLTLLHQKLAEWNKTWKIKYGIREVGVPAIPRKTLNLMRQANVTFIDYGCESGSPQILQRMGRQYNVDEMCTVIRNTHKESIIPGTWWSAGHPGETAEDVQCTLNALERSVDCGGLPMWITPLVVLPGTPLAKNPSEYGITDLWQGFESYKALADVNKHKVSASDYEYLITHETDVQTRRDIIEATWRIRKKIQELRPKALAMVSDRFFEEHPAFSRDLLPEFGANEEHAAGSYF